MFKYVMIGVLTAAVTRPAFAQDAASFTGPRVEVLAGHDSLDVGGEATSGLSYGLGAGYDLQAGGAVLGVDAEITESSASECISGFGIPNGTLCSNVGRDFYVGARAGAALGSNVLLYAKAGYTNARLRTSWGRGTPGAGVDRNFKLDGWRIGAGAEFAITSNLYAKAEYRYSRYGQDENDFVGGDASQPINLPGDSLSRNQVVGGFGFRF